jgi:hypothetical protein
VLSRLVSWLAELLAAAGRAAARAPRPVYWAALALLAALAAVVIATGTWPPSTHATPLRLPPLPLRDNKQRLSAAATSELLKWARTYQRCAVRRGIALDAPVVGHDEIVITGRRRSKVPPGAMQRAFSCTRQTGDPPPFSAFALLNTDHLLHLYRPRTCRLPVIGGASA